MLALCKIVLLNLFLIQQPVYIIDGYANKLSAFPGDSIELYLNADQRKDNYKLKLYDLGGKEVANYSLTVFPQTIVNDKPYENGFGYSLTKRIKVPNVPSGVYLWDNKIPFIIKRKDAKVTILYTSNTINAYCNGGGKSLYGFNSTDKVGAQKVSFLRPLTLSKFSESFLQWVHEQKMADVGYITDMDLEEYSSIKNSKLLIVPGHSEYWTLQARKNFDRFIQEGKHAMILSGNTMWWQVRYNKTKDQLICYRNKVDDPIKDTRLKTVNWNDSTLRYSITSSIGAEFTYAGYGLKNDRGWDGYKIVTNSPLFENTQLKPGDILPLPTVEADGTLLQGFVNDVPIIDYQSLGFYKAEIIGFDYVSKGTSTWIVCKPTRSSGIIINTASTDWCSYNGIGRNEDIRTITKTMIRKLLNNENVFSTDDQLTAIN